MAEVRTFEFNALPEATRARFAYAAGGRDPATRALHVAPAPISLAGPIVLALLGLTFSGALALAGLGDLESDAAWHGPLAGLFFVLGIFAFFLGTLSAIRRRQLRTGLPFPPGRYLFPADFVDARGSRLRLVAMNDLAEVRPVVQPGQTVVALAFRGGPVEELRFPRGPAASEALRRLSEASQHLGQAAEAQDWTTLANLDPFFELRWVDWNLDDERLVRGELAAPVVTPPARWLSFRAPIALAVALLVGVPALLARNLVSDLLIWDKAKTTGTEAAYQSYLRRGWLHRDDARAALPEAAFRDAVRKATVTALRDVLRRYPEAGLDARVRLEVHKLFQRTLQVFRGQAATSDPRLMPFVEALLAHLESTARASVQLRFGSPSPAALDRVDQDLRATAGRQFGKDVAPAARHFDAASAQGRQRQIAEKLIRGFAAIFPADVLNLSQGPPLTSLRQEVDVPSILVDYAIDPSGSFYESRESGRMFVGIRVRFRVSMRVPGEATRYDFDLEVTPPHTFSVSYDKASGGPRDEQVYEVMATRAFDELDLKLRGTFFRAGSTAHGGGPAPAPR